MPEAVENPRRGWREPIRCRATLELRGARLETTTEDLGARGCRVVLPGPVRLGERLTVTLAAAPLASVLRAAGRIAWVGREVPVHAGIAFEGEALEEAHRWMEPLLRELPEHAPPRHVPHRLPLEAMVFLGAPPGAPEFTFDQLTMLEEVGAGIRLLELLAALPWPRARVQRALFSLLGQRFLTLSRVASHPPSDWKGILSR